MKELQEKARQSLLPFDDTSNKIKRGRDADAYYRSHHETDTVIGHSLGGSISLALEKKYKQEGNNPYGIIQSKTFGSPTISGKISNPLLKNTVKDESSRFRCCWYGIYRRIC